VIQADCLGLRSDPHPYVYLQNRAIFYHVQVEVDVFAVPRLEISEQIFPLHSAHTQWTTTDGIKQDIDSYPGHYELTL